MELEPELVAVALLLPDPHADSRSKVDDQGVLAAIVVFVKIASAVNVCNWLQVVPRRIQIPYGAPKSTTRLDGSGAVVRIVLFRVSATYRSPFAFTAIPWGVLNRSQFSAPDTPWAARNRRHHAAGRNLPDRMVVGVGDIQRPRVVHRNGLRPTEPRGAARAIVRPERPGQARQRRHHAGGGNLPDRVVVGVGDIHRARGVDRHASRKIESRGAARAVGASSRCPARPASVVTMPPGAIFRIV